MKALKLKKLKHWNARQRQNEARQESTDEKASKKAPRTHSYGSQPFPAHLRSPEEQPFPEHLRD